MLINWVRCKQRTIHLASFRAHKFTRVSDKVRLHLDRLVAEAIVRIVNAQPNKGKTIDIGD